MSIIENQIATSRACSEPVYAWQSVPEAGHIPTDRHSHETCPVRGLLCCLPSSNQAQESSLPSVFAAIPHHRSPSHMNQNNLLSSLCVAPVAFLICLKQTGCEFLPVLAQVKAGQLRPLLQWFSEPLLNTFTWRSLSVMALCGETEPQRLVCLSSCIPIQQDRAQQREQAAEHV